MHPSFCKKETTKQPYTRFVGMIILLIGLSFSHFSSTYAQTVLKIEGEVGKPLTLTREELTKMPTVQVTAKDRDGKDRHFNGVALIEILKVAGVTTGAQLRGENMAKYVLVKAADGYQVVFSLPELDSEFTSTSTLVAFEADGKPLAVGEGPFRLVVPTDKKQARWIREVVSIQVAFAK